MRIKLKQTIFLVIFVIGAIAGFTLATLTNWPDFEAAFFVSGIAGEEPLKTLNCPIMITTAETGTITLRLDNTHDKTLTRMVITSISSNIFTSLNNFREQVNIEPGEIQELSWMVDVDNATYKSLIMFRTHITRRYPFPRQDGYCGIFVLDTPAFTGMQILTFLILVGTAGMGLGAFGWIMVSKPLIGKKLNIARALVAMTFLLFFAALFGYLRMWLFGALLILLAALLTISALPMYIIGDSAPE